MVCLELLELLEPLADFEVVAVACEETTTVLVETGWSPVLLLLELFVLFELLDVVVTVGITTVSYTHLTLPTTPYV